MAAGTDIALRQVEVIKTIDFFRALLFGKGGTYTIKELRGRAVMFGMLESDISLMSHDLEEFLREISAPGDI